MRNNVPVLQRVSRKPCPVSRVPEDERMKVTVIIDSDCETRLDAVVEVIDYCMQHLDDPIILIRGDRDNIARAWAYHEWCMVRVYWPASESQLMLECQADAVTDADHVLIIRPQRTVNCERLTLAACELVKANAIAHTIMRV